MDVGILTAFAAGALSFFSPCILPLLPAYISMLSGFSAEELRKGGDSVKLSRISVRAALFCLGFSTIFITMGAAAASAGGFLISHKNILLKVFGILTILFGLHIAGAFKIAFLDYEKRLSISNSRGNAFGAFLMGCAFALGWSPCIGPVLGSILSFAILKGTTFHGVAMLTAYSAGIALPMMATALFTAKIFSLLKNFRRHIGKIEIASGIILVILGILLFFDRLMFID
ncbi:MAG: cytochrome c biogenesis protein CcdA [Elusimicrobiales bacterium]|nr:cytochrome c biogenesis protein CcdA [Elusimicrobiales bacterium]